MVGHRKTQRARELRQGQTVAEWKLWQVVRDRRLGGFKFKRQVTIGPFIADFACKLHRLVVELDGSQHAGQAPYDEARTKFLEASGYRVLRFWNNDVLDNIEGVIEVIQSLLLETRPRPNLPSSTHPSGAAAGERDKQ